MTKTRPLTPRVFASHEAVSRHAAGLVIRQLTRKHDSLLCLATGGTPTRLYDLLRDRAQRKPALFRQARLLKLDEWGGLSMDNPATCEHYLQNALIKPLGLQRRYHGFRSDPLDPETECRRMASWLRRHGPIDLCILGLGINGHLALNEPASALRAESHVARLSSESLQHGMLKSSLKLPRYGLTLGLGEIMQSDTILLLVSGASKRAPMRQLLQPEVRTDFPASFLHLHPRVQLLIDRDAKP